MDADETLSSVVAVAEHCELMYKLSCIVMHLISDPLYTKSEAASDLTEIVTEMEQDMPEIPTRKEVAAAVEGVTE